MIGGLTLSSSQEVVSPSASSQIFNSLLPPLREPWTNVSAPSQAELDELFGLGSMNYNNDFSAMDVGGLPNNTAFTQANFNAPMGNLDLPSQFNSFVFDQPNQGALPLLQTPSKSSCVDLSTYFGGDLMAVGGSSTGSSSTSGSSSGSSSILQSSPNLCPSGSCSCQGRALDLMEQPIPLQNQRSGSKSGKPSFESVLNLNNTATDAMSEILQCPCGKDAYILVVLALATFKCLEWFDAASAEGELGLVSEPSRGIGGGVPSDGNPSRAAAQIVLSKLPDVNIICRTLSDQLRDLHQDGEHINGLRAMKDSFGTQLSSGLATSLAVDLRKATLNLAKRVIVRLR